MENIILEILFFIVSFLGVLIMIFGIPGNFIPPVIVLVCYLWGDGTFKFWLFPLFLILAISGEVVESLMGMVGAKKYGASKIGMAGAMIGGLIGSIIGTALLPVIGTIIGAFGGSFGLAFIFEKIFSKRTVGESLEIGKGALLGKVAAIAYKYTVGFVLLGLLAWRFWIYR